MNKHVVTFHLRADNCGSSIPCIYGNHPALGGGDINKAVPMTRYVGAYNYRLKLDFDTTPADTVLYGYCFKSPFGHITPEAISKRVLPAITADTELYDTAGKQSTINEVTLHFRIRFNTYPGQELFIFGNIPELGNWKKEAAIPLFFENHLDYWSGYVVIPRFEGQKSIEYKYFVLSPGGHIQEENSQNHKLLFNSVTSPSYVEINDVFRHTDAVMDALSRDAFTKVVYRRDQPVVEPIVTLKTTPAGMVTVVFSAYCPQVAPGEKLTIVGSIPQLGSWNPAHSLQLNDGEFPFWKGSVTLPRNAFPFQYKYAIAAQDTLYWENDTNRVSEGITARSIDSTYPATLFQNDWYVHFNKTLPRGLGIYSPLFSIRTSTSCGIGQYTDIKSLVDVCNKTGSSLIQLLPINDTTDKGEWADSYPYRQVSCFALHPVYIDLLAIPGITEDVIEVVNKQKYIFEQIPQVDYPAVYAFKLNMTKRIFAMQKDQLAKDKKLQEFINKNAKWLKPYALFCYLRDQYKTSVFTEWPEHQHVTPAQVEQMTTKLHNELLFIYWQQYLCDVQYKQSFDYATEKKVVIKGDLPIGVHLYSVECWASPELFNVDQCAGAPPDAFSGDGQNWGFPTYNWEKMAEDGLQWWRSRLSRMAELYHALRVDHVLGFFRIWEIPRDKCVRGLLGHYSPSLPLSTDELRSLGLWDIDRYVKPYVPYHILERKFGGRALEVSKKYFKPRGARIHDDFFDFLPEFDTEKKIFDYFTTVEDYEFKEHDKACLLQLICNVLLIEDEKRKGWYHPRTEIKTDHLERDSNGSVVRFISSSWEELEDSQRNAFDKLAHEFQYERHTKLWTDKAEAKLRLLKDSTNMLICAEDLGQITKGILDSLEKAALLGLRVQRMSKDPAYAFDDYKQFPYLSVACPSTHDSPSLRGWWEEEKEVCRKYWYEVLCRHEEMPEHLESWVQEMIIRQHLWSESMWSIFLLQDLTGIDEKLASMQRPKDEQINDPSDPNHKWRYRYPFTCDELIRAEGFTRKMKDMAVQSKRI